MHPTLQRLDDIATCLSARDDTIAVLGLGSAGAQRARLDDHSDLDFLLVVMDGAKWRYLDRYDWLEEQARVVYSFANERDGRCVLYADGIFAEYRVLTVAELAHVPFSGARLVWRRADAPQGLAENHAPVPHTPYDSAGYHLNYALTCLYTGMHLELRGERLAAMREIQTGALDSVIALARLETGEAPYRDPFNPSRRVERTYPLPLAAMAPGYTGNADAARAILEWLSKRYPVDPAIGSPIRELIRRSDDYR
ncbi:hypothetical protein AB0M02_26055 [Actinoplanes sp. NPDC051861]|uniref:hypothetical protein n=1 Tax=Actinoplanes sp. NPDC051861 TaxID=3155170 RepID=UPI0034329B20